MNLYLRARMEQEVDVVLEVKLARRSRPQFIANYASISNFQGWDSMVRKPALYLILLAK